MNTWPIDVLFNVVELQRGHDLPAPNRMYGEIPVIGSFGVTGRHNQAKYDGPGVAIGRSGASIGTATFVDGAYWPLNTCLFVRDFKGNDERWVYYLLDSIDFSAFNSGSAQPSLNRNFLRDIPVALPPLADQRAVADVLRALDEKIAANNTLAVQLDQFASVQYELARGLANERIRLSDLVTKQYGLTTSAHAEPGPKLMRVTDMNKKPWVEWESTPNCTASELELAKYRVEPGDVLVARMADPGKVAFVDDGHPEAVFASYLVRLKTRDPRHALYVYYFLRSDEYKRYAAGAMQGSVQKNMNASVIVAADISLPPEYALSGFTEAARSLRNSINAAQNENSTLKLLRGALLPELISGRLRVKDAEKKIEEVV